MVRASFCTVLLALSLSLIVTGCGADEGSGGSCSGFATDLRVVQSNVVQHGTREDMEVLQDYPDPSAQVRRADLVHIDTVEENHTVIDVVKSG